MARLEEKKCGVTVELTRDAIRCGDCNLQEGKRATDTVLLYCRTGRNPYPFCGRIVQAAEAEGGDGDGEQQEADTGGEGRGTNGATAEGDSGKGKGKGNAERLWRLHDFDQLRDNDVFRIIVNSSQGDDPLPDTQPRGFAQAIKSSA